jgi:hypothetical protein
MKVDLRAFDYALEPLRMQRQWQMDALYARLGRIQRAVREAERELGALRDGHELQCRRAAELFAERLDPSSYPRTLKWLAGSRLRIQTAEDALAELQAERVRVGAECVQQQNKVDAMERHRGECVSEFVQKEHGRQSSEADRDWLSRGVRS